MGRFAKNFLPILFNVYSQPQEEGSSSTQRRSVLDTVRAYLTITDPQVSAGAPRGLPRFMGKRGGSAREPTAGEGWRQGPDAARLGAIILSPSARGEQEGES